MRVTDITSNVNVTFLRIFAAFQGPIPLMITITANIFNAYSMKKSPYFKTYNNSVLLVDILASSFSFSPFDR